MRFPILRRCTRWTETKSHFENRRSMQSEERHHHVTLGSHVSFRFEQRTPLRITFLSLWSQCSGCDVNVQDVIAMFRNVIAMFRMWSQCSGCDRNVQDTYRVQALVLYLQTRCFPTGVKNMLESFPGSESFRGGKNGAMALELRVYSGLVQSVCQLAIHAFMTSSCSSNSVSEPWCSARPSIGSPHSVTCCVQVSIILLLPLLYRRPWLQGQMGHTHTRARTHALTLTLTATCASVAPPPPFSPLDVMSLALKATCDYISV